MNDSDKRIATIDELNNEIIATKPLLKNHEISTSKISLSSTNSKSSNYPYICRICHCEGTNDEPLISPCLCLGTMKYLHQSCLQQWIKSAGVKSCELCKFEFIMHSEMKPFKQWQKLEMNVVERRKIMCSIAFILIAVTCVLWSLCVLIEKIQVEIRMGKFEWPLWTKFLVVTIGFTGGLVFLYVQCKMYIQLCIRWRQFNQRIVIHSITEQQLQQRILSSKMKNRNNDNCIDTILAINDLSPLNINTSLTIMTDQSSIDSIYPRLSNFDRNQYHENNHNNCNVLHRYLILHRPDPSS